jgi:hypothetical protein
MPHYGPEVTQKVYELIDAGQSQGQVQRSTGVPQPTISRWLTKRRTGGAPSEPVSAPTVHPTVHYGSPDIARQTDLADLTTRVSVLEAFIATLQQQQIPLPGSPNGSPTVHRTVHPGSPSGAPTHKRGFVLADDLFEAIHTYAKTHHLQVKDVLDLALRTFFAQVGEEVRDA